ncbi:MAG TPA: TRAP transporter small permease [Anaeromyxobacter sp.]|nr:TRAP transporter small permease [Anaeromyxobacter sp.]
MSVLRRAWDHLEEWLLAALLAVMVAITFVTVVTRYVLDLPLSYVDQLVPNLFVWVTFLGASAAMKRRAHLGLSLVADLLPPRARAALDVVVLVGTSAFFLSTAWFGVVVVQLQVQNDLTTSLGYPAWVIGIAVPAGALLLVVRAWEAWWRQRRGRALAPAPPVPID